ncbi:hypothetical protein P153DRAFT_362507 [Dothidotthia symphoricarpi CBS 119687]|uniref:Uncharacterized protein n=1 Tax=Dothidotthia symphoricarpi CBS 119687 TaxID=1392245 RepID=A0A6A6ASX9_9PLEO|nr:uncharacterized protein P153DRAFT_362507 [Dothidotthia symphoricarpi CBS 119687]KAF2134770.1 hypothetical protein P153DRAFT_362507 [Dothidotthia symphoricarpi CBS 119687]
MPSYLRSPHRSFSFPPCIDGVDIQDSSEDGLPDIDEEPFAHFLTPLSEEDDPYDPFSFNAGIISQSGPRTNKVTKFKSNVADKWARYVKQDHAPLHEQYHSPAYPEDDEEESFMSLDDDRLYDAPQAVTHITSPRITITEPSRGRDQDLISRKVQNRRRYSRTLSGHRHSWREPSPELFTVDESEEEETPVVRRQKTRKAKDGADRRRSSTRSRSRMRGDLSERAKL